QTENLTLESPGVRQQITQGLTNQRKQILNAALLETAMNEARITNNLASNMLANPGNLGLRPAASTSGAHSTPAASATPQSAQQPAPTDATSAPVTVKPSGSPSNTNK